MNTLFRLLLFLYPASWRAEYGEQMASLFALRLRASRGLFATALLCLEAVPDLLLNALSVQFDLLGQDLRQSLRTLRRSPGFSAAAIAIAALGIGSTTAAFSMVDHVFLNPLPYRQPDRLVQLREDDLTGLGRFWDTSPANYRDWKRMSTVYESMGAFRGLSVNLNAQAGDPERLDGASVTVEVFPTLAVQPALGRFFSARDGRLSEPAVVVLSYGLWQDRFGANRNVLGQTIHLDNLPYTIVGVMPRDFYFPDREARLWTPMRWTPDDFSDRRDTYIFPVGRLKPNVSLPQARAEIKAVAARLARAYPKELAPVGVVVGGFRDLMPARTRLMLTVLLAASLCVLLISCLNLASLLLARSLVRRRELAVRAALGAGRERLIRQVLTESIVLAIPGGVLGLLLAQSALPLLVQLVPVSLPLPPMPAMDLRVVLFAALVTFATGIGFGVLPALRSRKSSAADLHAGGRSGMGARRERLRAGLVIAEIACSVVLLVGFGLLTRALWRIQSVNPGFRPDHVLTLRTQLPMPRYETPETREPYYREVLTETQRLPAVTAAAYTSFLPMAMGGGIWPVEIEGHPESLANRRTASLRFVTPHFFAAMGIPVRSGRDFGPFDLHARSYVSIVSESFVHRYWPNENPIGRHIDIGNHQRLVIGIAGDIRNRGPERISEPQVYVAWQQADDVSSWYAPKDLVVRTTGDPSLLISSLRRIVHQADPTQSISNIRTLTDVVQEQTASRRVELAALGAFGAVALLLAAVGIHALLAFTVATRTQEIGVRLALGARPLDVVRMTLTEGLSLAAIGIALGTALAFAAGHLLESLLAGVKPWDPGVLLVAIAISLAMTLAGSWLPAMRAARVDPTTAMRAE